MAKLTRQCSELRDEITLSRGGITERFISARVAPPPAEPLDIFAGPVPPGEAMVSQFVFGGCSYHPGAMQRLNGRNWPILWVQGDTCSGEHLAGQQSHRISGTAVRGVELDGKLVGCAYADDDAEYCWLSGLLPADVTRSRPEQARSCFERMEAALQTVGMEFTHVVRTWLFLENLLDWYGEFNTVRTRFFQERGVFDHLVPSSTGIGGGNPWHAALVSAAVAVKPRHPGVKILDIPSPLQCPAPAYRSSFARATEMAFPDRRQLFVSGTASIAPGGESVHLGDIDKQIALTMDVIEAILKSRDMSWSDTTRMIGYFRDIREASRFHAFCRERNLPPLPVVFAHAVVCRDDLLFEAEMDAIQAR